MPRGCSMSLCLRWLRSTCMKIQQKQKPEEYHQRRLQQSYTQPSTLQALYLR